MSTRTERGPNRRGRRVLVIGTFDPATPRARQWLRLLDVLGERQLGDDPRFATIEARWANRRELDPLISAATAVWEPTELSAVLDKDPSFVFFRALPPPASPDDGPPGAEGVPLMPGRSLAVDRKFLPLGIPLWLDAEDPVMPGARLRRLLIAQDTGGAIRGPVRGDLFWGHGADAALHAGSMKSSGRYWIFLPRDVAARRAATS